MTATAAALSPAQKAWQTRRARAAQQAAAPVMGFAEADAMVASLDNDALVELFGRIGRVVADRCLKGRQIMSSWTAVIDYLRSVMAFEPREQFRVLFLDKRNALIADEVLGHGTVDHVPVYPREVLRRALELNACTMILVHNHPSNDTTPSRADIAMTEALIGACNVMGIAIHDHIIVGRSGHSSLKALGLM